MSATYTKLQDGSWGVRVPGSVQVVAGMRVTVAKKDGTTKPEIISRVVWSGKGRDGAAVHLCAIEQQGQRVYDPQKFNGYGRAKGGYRKACVSGGNCSSIGNGTSCGGHDCDGW